MGENFGPSYFAIITGPLLDNRALAANAKLLYASITSLTDSRGYCWASNKYLADRFGWGERTVTRLVAQLQEHGFIRTAMALNKETGQMERRIYIGNEAAEGVAKIGDPSQNWRGGVAKTGEAIYMLNKKEEYIPPKAPQGGRRGKREPKNTADWKPERFEAFWAYYRTRVRGEDRQAAIRAWDKLRPDDALIARIKNTADWKPERFEAFWAYYRTRVRGEDRQAAIRAWDKLRPDDALIARIGRALEKQVASESWQAGYGKPYASTYLNRRRWEDVEGLPDPDGEAPREAPKRYVRTDVIDGQEVDIYE